MQWKKWLWYSIVYFLITFLVYYVSKSIILIHSTLSVSFNSINNWGTLIANYVILLLEAISSLGTILIYYYIGSSSAYKPIKNEKNPYLTRNPLPFIIVAIPTYKEPIKVVSQTIEGALKLDYPKDRYKVVVCDDTPVGENLPLKEFCEKKGVDYLHRNNRKGFKGGALNNLLKHYNSDFLAILDSDHIPTPNFLKTCLSGFVEEKIIMVQAKPLFVNQDNYMQRSSAFIHTQFYQVYQKSRSMRDCVIFAGTTGMFRTDYLKKEGGFLEDTIAEDTDTSLVLVAKGYKTRYLSEICSKGLVPWTPISIINQVWRWTHGIATIFRLRLKHFVLGKTSLINKIDMIITSFTPIIGFSVWVANVILLALYYLGIPILRPTITAQSFPLFLFAPVLISFASVILAIIAWLREEKEDKMIRMRGIKGMMWTITAFYLLMATAQSFLIWAVISAIIGIKKEFKRTEKAKPKTLGTWNEKVKYTTWSIGLFILAIGFYIASYQTFITGNALFGWFVMASVYLTIPIIIVITYFPKLDLLQFLAANKSAADVEREYKVKSK